MHESEYNHLIRQFIDGELSEPDAAGFEARLRTDADLRQRVEFERQLRARISAVMAGMSATAPATLNDGVRTALRDSASIDAVEVVNASEAAHARESVAGTITPAARPSAPPARKASWFAIAASLAIVAGAVLFGIYGPRLDGVRVDNRLHGADLVESTAEWSSREHSSCAMRSQEWSTLLPYQTFESAQAFMSEHLGLSGEAVELFDLCPIGFTFSGCGPCADAPGGVPACRIVYRRAKGEGCSGAVLSFFVIANPDRFDDPESQALTPGEWSRSDGSPSCRHKVLRTLDDRVAFFMVCCDPSATSDVCRLLAPKLSGGLCQKR